MIQTAITIWIEFPLLFQIIVLLLCIIISAFIYHILKIIFKEIRKYLKWCYKNIAKPYYFNEEPYKLGSSSPIIVWGTSILLAAVIVSVIPALIEIWSNSFSPPPSNIWRGGELDLIGVDNIRNYHLMPVIARISQELWYAEHIHQMIRDLTVEFLNNPVQVNILISEINRVHNNILELAEAFGIDYPNRMELYSQVIENMFRLRHSAVPYIESIRIGRADRVDIQIMQAGMMPEISEVTRILRYFIRSYF